MKPPAVIHPNVTVTVTGSITRRMRLGLRVMRFGAWLLRNGGVKLTYSSKGPRS